MTTPTTDDEAAIEATKAPLMDHLIELRKRLVWSMIAFVGVLHRLLLRSPRTSTRS